MSALAHDGHWVPNVGYWPLAVVTVPATGSPDQEPAPRTATGVRSDDPAPDLSILERLGPARAEVNRFLLEYRSGIEAVRTKITILQQEFLTLHDHNPIEHVGSRLKTPESIIAKAARKDLPLSLPAIRAGITDIAGVRVTCSFVSDVHGLAETLTQQPDLTVVRVKDHIAAPKANGYRSLHLQVTVPVFLSTSVVHVPVEIQLRTTAMDFWASLEHKIHYKYDAAVPADVRQHLREAAETAHHLDSLMEHLHRRVHTPPDDVSPTGSA
ncbi:GTP pyrophosphokinase [Modestobacter sp. VKM Ac-2985]|uniref:GTP pyrophosphokinase n=1 Tax=Modestobacter sp. VKM Ac-2985 TaxID=3004139 RepID=UPI0022AB74E1|nr:GTP pyrophosphokinase family protein [Modestobacter sp. VKM Ac-2985]MCZ2840174.1 GTP pyrophosphokinase family protein [Modestobacter sp. VKM Ac-2985]